MAIQPSSQLCDPGHLCHSQHHLLSLLPTPNTGWLFFHFPRCFPLLHLLLHRACQGGQHCSKPEPLGAAKDALFAVSISLQLCAPLALNNNKIVCSREGAPLRDQSSSRELQGFTRHWCSMWLFWKGTRQELTGGDPERTSPSMCIEGAWQRSCH